MSGATAGGEGEGPAPAGPPSARRLLDPDEHVSEVLFGIIMVVSITGTISIAAAGREEVGTMLRAALGCNLAWGITDAVMYLLSVLLVRGRGLAALRAARSARAPEAARTVIAHALPPIIAANMDPDALDGLRRRLAALPEPPLRPRLDGRDFLAAGAVCALVFLSTFPVAVPFLLMADATRALRLSNGIAIAMLFLTGWRTARHAGVRPWALGLAMVLLGVALVAIIVALGG